MNQDLKQTPLNGWHRAAGANMANFGGFDMPLWYETGVKTEHLAVLRSVGIFDTSHMACIKVDGDAAFDLLNFCFTRDLADLKAGRCVYGAFLDSQGHCLDDAIVYRFADHRFLVCVNAGMGAAIAAHLKGQQKGQDVQITDLTGQVAKVDIQGPKAARVMMKLLADPDKVFGSMPYFSFKGGLPEEASPSPIRLVDGSTVLLSRSGYTGEFGFEIFCDPANLVRLWEALLASGEEYGITPCGLGARDSLRAGACLPLSHQDIGDFPFIRHPWEFALPFSQDKKGFTKDFLGAKALLSLSTPFYTYAFAGDSLRKVNAGEQTRVVDEKGETIGRVLTCATDMAISRLGETIVSVNSPDLPKDFIIKGLSCGFVRVEKPLKTGASLTLFEGKRSIQVTVVQEIRPDRTARLALKHFL